MRKVFFDKIEEDIVIKLQDDFNNGNKDGLNTLEELLLEIQKQTDINLYFDSSLKEQESFFEGGLLLFFRELIQTNEPIEFEEEKNLQFYRLHCGVSKTEENKILCEIANLQAMYDINCLLITLNSYNSQPLLIIRNEYLEDGTCFTSLERIMYCNTVNELLDWLDRKLKFEHNPKHDSKKRKSNKGEDVAILHRDPKTEKDEIEQLLREAIKDEKSKRFYNYDKKVELYIVFMPHSENLYHAFHLENENEVPHNVSQSLKPKKKPK